MDDKSHVSLEQQLCLVCGTAFDTGNILLDRRLRASMKHQTTTGWGPLSTSACSQKASWPWSNANHSAAERPQVRALCSLIRRTAPGGWRI